MLVSSPSNWADTGRREPALQRPKQGYECLPKNRSGLSPRRDPAAATGESAYVRLSSDSILQPNITTFRSVSQNTSAEHTLPIAPFHATTASDDLPPPPSTESLNLLRKTSTVGGVLFDPAHSSRSQSRQNPTCDTRFSPKFTSQAKNSAKMDGKRHLSSFQQLEKLGEGTYATVSTLAQPAFLGLFWQSFPSWSIRHADMEFPTGL